MRFELEHCDDAPSLHRLGILWSRSRSLEAAILNRQRFAIVQAVLLYCLREADREVELTPRRPAACLAHAGYCAIAANPQPRPEHLAGIVVDRRTKIDKNMRRLADRVGIPVNANTSACRQLGVNSVIEQIHRVVTGLGPFLLVAEAGSIARSGFLTVTGFQLHIARDWLKQNVAKIGVSASGEVCVREPKNGGVFVAISGSPFVTLFEGANLRVRRKLHHAERYRRAWKGMAVRPGPDERIYQGQSGLRRERLLCDRDARQTEEQSSQREGNRI